MILFSRTKIWMWSKQKKEELVKNMKNWLRNEGLKMRMRKMDNG